ncbi:MAG: N-acetyl-gamma-glutamyl-phosphate reductase, partial [Methanomicrobiales archaeon]|nr:N-acetyl-gamma-glutamyl-phosphate reductase [Methanomicrobiales archaeon]
MEIAIIGASGYTGGELLRLLLTHSTADVTCATSRKLSGTPVDAEHPHLKGQIDLTFSNPTVDDIDADFAFLAVPHTVAMQYGGRLRERGIRVVDLSADYRLPKEVFEKVYGTPHTDYFTVPYGLTELHRDEVKNAKFVSNPGCFPTGATLAAAPLATRAHTIVFDSKTGVSGAGNAVTSSTHYPNVAD